MASNQYYCIYLHKLSFTIMETRTRRLQLLGDPEFESKRRKRKVGLGGWHVRDYTTATDTSE